ncbi:MAG: hypothetical protein R2873_06210 [Caldilineaceae bacterium]
MDVEWAKDGISGDLFIVQARPETVHSQRPITEIENYVLKEHSRVLAGPLSATRSRRARSTSFPTSATSA